ncbi:MAG: alkyl hydroperoxide reductase/Thiol specific antioxidant/Mal [Geobacteraceae bacterium]|nr:MAG: alkyl hydroperoxide reductase/Thiol specific antioxidant/Mal [Geobacteraceae bacterium]
MKRYIHVLLVILMFAVCSCAKEQAPPKEGGIAPDFKLKNIAGEEVRLADLRGKVVFLNFWATWCPPCREEIPSMVRLNTAMAGKPFQMLAVSIDEGGKEAVESYFKQAGVTLPALLDPQQATGKRYGITGVPETFIVDKKGVILKKIIGPMDWSDPAVVKYLDDAIRQ